jgi:hypothetical protein
MTIELCPKNSAAVEMLKPENNDRSGIGVHYVDAYLKPLRTGVKLPDGTKISAKRRGLKITLTRGTGKGEGLMRRLTVSRDPAVMLRAALDEAAEQLGIRLRYADGGVSLEWDS